MLGQQAADIYDQACEDWIKRDPRTADMLTRTNRPRVVPAGVVPYGRPMLAWIGGTNTAHPLIHVATGHKFSDASWRNGTLVQTEGSDLRSTLRHELAHWFQRQLNTRPDYGVRSPRNVHGKQSWLRTIAVWHNLQHVEDFVQHLMGRAMADKNFLAILRSYPFPNQAPDWAVTADRPIQVTDGALSSNRTAPLRTCIVCSNEYAGRINSQTCSAKCRVTLSRSKRTPEQLDAQRVKDAIRMSRKRQA